MVACVTVRGSALPRAPRVWDREGVDGSPETLAQGSPLALLRAAVVSTPRGDS